MAEVRKLGVNDWQIGETNVVSPGGKTVVPVTSEYIPVAYGTANDAVTDYSNVVFSVEDALNTSLDLRAYLPSGFVSDGSIDYATQIQTAITAAMSAKKPLVIPKGIWAFSSTLTITGPLYMTGVGKDTTQTQLKYTGTSGTAIKVSLDPQSASFIENVVLENFFLRVSATTDTALNLYMGLNCVFRNINIRGNDTISAGTRYGILVEGGVNNSFYNIDANGSGYGSPTADQYTTYGVMIKVGYGADPATTISFYDCYFHYYQTAAYINLDTAGASFYRTIFESSTNLNGVLVKSGPTIFNGCWFENIGNDTTAPIYITVEPGYVVYPVTIIGCYANLYAITKFIEAAYTSQINLFSNKVVGNGNFTVITAGGNAISVTSIGNYFYSVAGTVTWRDGVYNYSTFRRDNGAYYKTSVSSAPEYIGEESIVASEWYKAVGVTASGDWKKITP